MREELLKILYDERKILVMMITQTRDKLRTLESWKESLDKRLKEEQ